MENKRRFFFMDKTWFQAGYSMTINALQNDKLFLRDKQTADLILTDRYFYCLSCPQGSIIIIVLLF